MTWRRRMADPQGGAFAVLYAALVVVLIGMAAIVVDIAAVREDRRLNRSAADSAAIAGAQQLDNTAVGGASPQQACLRAWDYLARNLNVAVPAGACGSFTSVTDAAAYCTVATPSQITDTRTTGNLSVQIAWPVPSAADGGYLTPDIAPGGITQPGNATPTPGPGNTDGYSNGCDKLGVTVQQNQSFGLGGVWGYTGTTTQVHSVARVIPQTGPPEDAAALNVLNPTDCESLVTTGGGKVTVGPVLDSNGNSVSPGIIAVEASGTANCGGGGAVIDPTTGSGSRICASRTAIGASSCDGQGLILDHALDPGGIASRAYNTSAVPSNLTPQPVAEAGTHGYVPVTKKYGCAALSACSPPTVNYVAQLVAAYGGSGVPSSVYSSSQSPYINPYPGGFVDRSSVLCTGGITTVIIIPAGNNYANCTLDIKGAGVVIVQGGTLVLDGAIKNAGCLVMNTVVSTCPTGVSGSGAYVTSPIAPVHDAIVYLRGNGCPTAACFDNSGNLVFPQTFVYAGGTSPLNQASTGLTLWTAPGAGPLTSGRTTLENDCYNSTQNTVVKECMNSRFGRLTFWSEYAAPKTKPNQFAGQGQLSVVGVFFTPRAYFNFTGGGGYTGAAAQFWADQLNVNGGANLGLSPFEAFVVESLGPRIVLIR